MLIPEKIFLKKCKALIEEKLSWAESSQWKQRDFQNLSELIFEKTNILLSLSTLKRIWKKDSGSIPHPGTLNALAAFLDYKNWLEFKKEIADQLNGENGVVDKSKISRGTKISLINRYGGWFMNHPRFCISAIIVIGLIIVVSSVSYHYETDYDNVVFKSKTVVTEGVPNTVIFDYDISMLNFDSALIQQSWSPRYRDRILKENNHLTSIYYYPGQHKAKLIVDDQIIKEHKLLIKSDGWLSVVRYSFEDEIPIYIPKEKTISNGRIYITPEILKANNVDVSGRPFLLSYYNVREFENLDGDNFILETRVKNNLTEGGLVCQYLFLTVMCENGRIVIPLSMAGCVANLYAKFQENWIRGRDNDLSPFGCDMAEWNDLKLIIIDKQAVVEINGSKIFEASYTTPSGKIVGLCYTFYGSGSIDNVTLSDINNTPVYRDKFDDR